MCNSSATCWFNVVSFLIADLFARSRAPPEVLAPEEFLSKHF